MSICLAAWFIRVSGRKKWGRREGRKVFKEPNAEQADQAARKGGREERRKRRRLQEKVKVDGTGGRGGETMITRKDAFAGESQS